MTTSRLLQLIPLIGHISRSHARTRTTLTVALMAGLAAGLLGGATARAEGGTSGPSMLAARSNFALIQLPSGRILALGGIPDTGAIYDDRVEVLDAGLTAWSSAAPMPTVHRLAEHAVLLSTGEVLVAGESAGSFPPAAHLYNEATDSWSPTANTPSLDRHSAQMTTLPDGRVLYSAGYSGGGGGPTYASAEIYDPATKLWSPTGSLATARFGHGAALLTTGPFAGQVMACGGLDRATLIDTATCERFDPATNLWSPAPAMGSPRAQFTLTRLADGRLLAAGGLESIGTNRATAEIFDPVTGWAALPDMHAPRARHTATLMPDGGVLVAGGVTEGPFTLATSSIERFVPGNDIWIAEGDLVIGRGNHAAVSLPGARVLLAGGTGVSFSEKFATTEIFSLDTDGDGVPDSTDHCAATPLGQTVDALGCTPGEGLQALEDLVGGYGLPKGTANSLTAPLKQALALLTDSNPSNDGAVCGKLAAFVNQVTAKEGSGQLTAAQAAELREAAQAIQTFLGC